jgi:hypothetical protein
MPKKKAATSPIPETAEPDPPPGYTVAFVLPGGVAYQNRPVGQVDGERFWRAFYESGLAEYSQHFGTKAEAS